MGLPKRVRTDTGEIRADGVVLATGHSAHDVFRSLHASDVPFEAKGIAMGVRLEHPQHPHRLHPVSFGEGERPVSAGGRIQLRDPVGRQGRIFLLHVSGEWSSRPGSSDGELVVNGMSASARAGRWANSGMVVEIHPGDFPEYSGHGPLEMFELQESLERKMFQAAGNTIVALLRSV